MKCRCSKKFFYGGTCDVHDVKEEVWTDIYTGQITDSKMAPYPSRIEELRDHIQQVLELGDQGICCCGDSMDHSAMDYGHTPVNMFRYTLDCLQEELRELENIRGEP